MLDKMMETLALTYEVVSLADLHRAISTQSNSMLPNSLGVPGVFSVSAIPSNCGKGKLCLQLSGALLKPIMQISYKVPGLQSLGYSYSASSF